MENGFVEKKIHKELKPWQGILLFALVMLSYYTIIAWLQMRLGMYGLALTEIYLLVLSVSFTLFCGADLRKVFPVKKPEASKVFGTVLYWMGAYALVIPFTMIIAYFFPKEMFATSMGLNEILMSVPPVLTVLFASVMPAICEEAMHRGVIFHSMKKLKNEWLIILIMGVLFGLFHGNIWRFLPTAILGGALSYVMLKTENMIYPALFHFVNNFFPTLFSGGQADASSVAASSFLMENGLPLFTLGIYIAMGCAAPFLLFTGAYLLQKGNGRMSYFPRKNQTFWIVFLILATVLPLILGGMLFVYGIVFDDSIWRILEQMQNF